MDRKKSAGQASMHLQCVGLLFSFTFLFSFYSVPREGGGTSLGGGRVIGGGRSGVRTGGSSITYGGSTGGGRGGERGGSITVGGGSGGRTETRESVHYTGVSTGGGRGGDISSGDGTGGRSCGITGGGERISGVSSSSSHSYSSSYGHSASQPCQSGESYGKKDNCFLVLYTLIQTVG